MKKNIIIIILLPFILWFTFSDYLSGDIESEFFSWYEFDDSNPVDQFRDRQSNIIDSIYDNTNMDAINELAWSRDRLNSLNSQFNSLVNQFEDIEQRRDRVHSRYEEISSSLENIIWKMEESKDNMSKIRIKVNMQTRRIWILENKLIDINNDINETKDDIVKYTNILYRINNDFYWSAREIDDVRLLVSSNNIADSLSSEEIIKSMVIKMDDMMSLMNDKQSSYEEYSNELISLREDNRRKVEEYQTQIDIYEEQQKYLWQLLSYLEEDKEDIDEYYESIFEDKKSVQNRISNINKQVEQWIWTWDLMDISLLYENSDRDNEWNFFSWPVNNIEWISAFYDDESYEKKFWSEHKAVDLVVEQWSEVYAPANWIVYHVVDQDWPWLNWMIMINKHWYITAYLHMSKIMVEPWDFVKRWEIIWLSWWTPWTRWAWLMSTWPHLHFEVIKNWEYVDPFELMDLSVIPSRNMLQSRYHRKYIQDSMSRKTDMNNLTQLSWTTVEERRKEYISRNAVWDFNDLSLWERASDWLWVDIDLWICIAAAESWLGNNLTTPYNVWNVWNNDRWDRVGYDSAYQWARVIYLTLANNYLWEHYKLTQLSRYWNMDWTIYASSDYNWQNNVVRCLSSIKWYWVPDDYFFRRYEWDRTLVLSSAP